MLVDTHCHIHEPQYFSAPDALSAIDRALSTGVNKLVCIGTSEQSSRDAVRFAADNETC